MDDACVDLTKKNDADTFIDAMTAGKFWLREPNVRPLPGKAPPKAIKN